MQSKVLDDLTIYSSGWRETRIVLVATRSGIGSPRRIHGTRWLTFGDEAADRLAALVQTNSWLHLNSLLPGGFTSALQQTLDGNWRLESPQIISHDGLDFLLFGRRKKRVLLLRAGPGLLPQRIGPANIIALSPRACYHFAHFLNTLPDDPAAAEAAAAAFIHGGLNAGTIETSRRVLRTL